MGVLLSLIFCATCTIALLPLIRKLWPQSDPAEQVGLSGLIGLGCAGTLVTLLGLLPNFIKGAVAGVAIVSFVLAAIAIRGKHHLVCTFKLPTSIGLVSTLVLAIGAFLSLVAALTPSTIIDWDSLAYHLAVPKLWLQAGEVHFIPTIHHSNFPFALDGLYLFGLTWGGESAAKIFTWATLILGMIALYGVSRRWTNPTTAWVAPVLFAFAPVVLWESGTAYIDVGHGLYAGLAIAYLAEFVLRQKQNEQTAQLPTLVGILLGLTLGTKFTGIQVAIAALLVYVIAAKSQIKEFVKPAGVIAIVTVAVSGAWFVKTTAYTGNPVFPFFHEQFQSPHWDQKRADIYRHEQQTFGVGQGENRDWSQIGHAILGLAYQPGRYVNPAQQFGGGFPTGSIGFACMLTFLVLAASGRARGKAGFILGWVGVMLLLWFILSQQSRYLTLLVVPASVLAAYAAHRTKWSYLLAGAVGLQAAYSIWMVGTTQSQNQLRVMLGQVSPADYRKATTPFASMAEKINADSTVTKVALYDEVFGFLLDKSYVWANPGHGLTLDYEKVESPSDLIALLKDHEFDAIYYGFVAGREDRDRWLATAGLGSAEPYSAEELAAIQDNWEVKWKALLALAVQEGLVTVTEVESRGILMRIPAE